MNNQVKIVKKIKSFKNSIYVSSDKSLSIRCILLSSMAIGKSRIYNYLNSEDVINTLKSVKKIGEILANKNIESADQIDSSLIETIMSIISKEDLEMLLEKVQENSKFKEILHQINEKVQLNN